jgi:cell division septum initiation protein DivIVA
MITKKEELEIINETIGKLGEKSYLGPWLVSIRHELEAMMRADTFPSVSLADSEERARLIIERAEQNAQRIANRAENKAAEIEEAANAVLNRARVRIMDAQKDLAKIAINSL